MFIVYGPNNNKNRKGYLKAETKEIIAKCKHI